MVAVTTGYVERDTLKESLFLTGTTEWDSYLDVLLRTVQDVIDQSPGRSFLTSGVDEVRYFDGRGGISLDLDDLYSLTTVRVDVDGDGSFGTTLTLNADFVLYPLNDVQKMAMKLLPSTDPNALTEFPHQIRAVEVTATWGWQDVPGSVEQAALLTVTRWYKRKDADYPDETQARGVYILDPDVIALLKPYRVPQNEVLGAYRRSWG